MYKQNTCQKINNSTSISYFAEGKIYFHQTEINQSKRKQRSSPWFALVAFIFTCLLSVTVQAAPQTESEQHLRDFVAQHYEQELAQYALLNHWGKYTSEHQIWIPSAANHLPKCASPLTISGRDNQEIPIGRLKRAISCDDPDQSWKINITLKTSLTLDVVVAATTIARETSVTADALQLDTRTLTHDGLFFTALADAVGQQTTRLIRTGQVLSPRLLALPPLVEKGNQVVIIARKGKLTASTQGVALENGGKGEQIEVQNSSSGKTIRAVVSGLNEVYTQF